MSGGRFIGRSGGRFGGGLEVQWLVVFDKYFWRTLAFVTPTKVTSYIRACTENYGELFVLLFPRNTT